MLKRKGTRERVGRGWGSSNNIIHGTLATSAEPRQGVSTSISQAREWSRTKKLWTIYVYILIVHESSYVFFAVRMRRCDSERKELGWRRIGAYTYTLCEWRSGSHCVLRWFIRWLDGAPLGVVVDVVRCSVGFVGARCVRDCISKFTSSVFYLNT